LSKETATMAMLMRQYKINEKQMEAILTHLQMPNFDLAKLAPSLYYLKKVESQFMIEVWKVPLILNVNLC
jgi:hypothetical protein